MPDLHLLEQRLERLERANRRWRRAAALAGLLFCAALSASLGRAGPSVIEAERFVLKGADGAEHGVLGLDETGSPMLLLERGKANLLLTLSGPALSLRADDGKRGAFLGVDTRGESRLELRSERFLDGVRLVSKADGGAGLYLLDRDGGERGAAELTGEGNVLFSVRDAQRRVRGSFGLDANSIPNVVLLDSAGRRRIGMLVHGDAEGRPLFALEDGQGRTRAELTLDRDGSPNLSLTRPDGGKSFRAP